jgi:hypothetical protein
MQSLRKSTGDALKGKRPHISCTICNVHEAEASGLPDIRVAPLANGVRYKTEQERERLIDRLQSESHQAATAVAKAVQLMGQQETRSRKCSESQLLEVQTCWMIR